MKGLFVRSVLLAGAALHGAAPAQTEQYFSSGGQSELTDSLRIGVLDPVRSFESPADRASQRSDLTDSSRLFATQQLFSSQSGSSDGARSQTSQSGSYELDPEGTAALRTGRGAVIHRLDTRVSLRLDTRVSGDPESPLGRIQVNSSTLSDRTGSVAP